MLRQVKNGDVKIVRRSLCNFVCVEQRYEGVIFTHVSSEIVPVHEELAVSNLLCVSLRLDLQVVVRDRLVKHVTRCRCR